MADDRTTITAYEQPLIERVRTLLRLEYLFQQVEQAMRGDSEWHSRQVIATLIDILGVLSARGDIRGDLIKELERIAIAFERLRDSPEVDGQRLQPVLKECRRLADKLKSVRGTPGGELRNDELLAGIMQRAGIPGGTCSFDLPAYQHWLLKPAAERRAQLDTWIQSMDHLRESAALVLRMLRDSAEPQAEMANGGLYQQNLDRNTPYQLLRVLLPSDSPYFAEISGSRYFFTVRFMQQAGTRQRPVQTSDDVAFQLARCGL